MRKKNKMSMLNSVTRVWNNFASRKYDYIMCMQVSASQKNNNA